MVGKRGVTWHISYCLCKLVDVEKLFDVTVYSHIFNQTVSQNSNLVVGVIRHTLQEEKTQHPELKEAYYRSDCAGHMRQVMLLFHLNIWRLSRACL